MIIKIVTVFLIGMAVLAMFGRLRLPRPGTPPLSLHRRRPEKCPNCGRHRIGRGRCPCEKG
nr:hypothetical protein [Rhodovulum bhavnagarense]